jgi:hypothetical protein
LSNDGSNVWDSSKKKSGEFYSSRGLWELLEKTHLIQIVNSKDDGKSLHLIRRGSVSRYQLAIPISVPLEIPKC